MAADDALAALEDRESELEAEWLCLDRWTSALRRVLRRSTVDLDTRVAGATLVRTMELAGLARRKELTQAQRALSTARSQLIRGLERAGGAR